MASEHVRYRETEARRAWERGWALMPLRGKVPVLDGWPNQPKPELEQVLSWARQGNLGLRTGAVSGIFVVDEDTAKGGRLAAAPVTVTVLTGGGGRHLYFRAPDPCPGNSASKVGPHIDTRGEGGQVVFVGSIHPVTGQVYRWAPGLSPDEVQIAELPPHLYELLLPPKREPPPPTPRVQGFPGADALERYARAALERETSRVAAASPGERNDALNRAAFSLGQLVAGGVLPRDLVEAELRHAAHSCGLVADDGERSALTTIHSGLSSGATRPRRPVLTLVRRPAGRPGVTVPAGAAEPEESLIPEVLTPGAHIDDQAEYYEVGNHDFADAVLAALPPGTVYARGSVPGELIGGSGKREFRPLTYNRLRVLVDRHVRLVAWRKKKSDGAEEMVKVYCPCSRDQAGVVMDSAPGHPCVRDLRMLISYPVFLGPDFELSAPGWNQAHGVFYDQPEDLTHLDLETPVERCAALLEDLTIDFPWKDAESRQNFYGLLLTPLIRPALGGNTPLFLILSSLERTGKSKLAEQVVGGIILGNTTPAIQLGGSDEERDKRIIAQLQRGTTIVHVDNVREFLDSAALASLLTASTYAGRVLGRSEIVSVPNTMTIIASGNNVRATGEIVKRTVPIQLQPRTDAPEQRVDFKHPDLPAYIAESRPAVLGALLSAVRRWLADGREQHPAVMGGFERWSQITGGILMSLGLGDFLGNAQRWSRQANPEGEDLRSFVEFWSQEHGTGSVTARELLAVVEKANLFGHVFRARSEHGQLMSFSKTVLSRYVDTPVGDWIIREKSYGNGRYFYLDQN